MNNEIKDIIISGFEKLKDHCEYEIKNSDRFVKHLEESLMDDTREKNLDDKYTDEDIENIKEAIKDHKKIVNLNEVELYNCKKVLKFFEGYTPNYYFKTNK